MQQTGRRESVTEVSTQIDIPDASMAARMTLSCLKLQQIWQTLSLTRTMQSTGNRESLTEVSTRIDIPPEPSVDDSVLSHAAADLADIELDPDHAVNRQPREPNQGKHSD